jgi:hypothetical protein
MYAQRGHGKRSGFYSDYTFGVWRGPGELVPVGKAYFGFTDEELAEIDKYVRNNTIERFGPVRSVRAGVDQGLVFEVAFEGINRSSRHKSGVAMRFPRISRLRWDKPPARPTGWKRSKTDDRHAALTDLPEGTGDAYVKMRSQHGTGYHEQRSDTFSGRYARPHRIQAAGRLLSSSAS